MIDYRPQWYEDAQPEAAHAASEIHDDDRPLTPAEVYVLVAIWALSVGCVLSLLWLAREMLR